MKFGDCNTAGHNGSRFYGHIIVMPVGIMDTDLPATCWENFIICKFLFRHWVEGQFFIVCNQILKFFIKVNSKRESIDSVKADVFSSLKTLILCN